MIRKNQPHRQKARQKQALENLRAGMDAKNVSKKTAKTSAERAEFTKAQIAILEERTK